MSFKTYPVDFCLKLATSFSRGPRLASHVLFNLNIFTFDGCRQRRRKDEAGTAEVNNAKVLDNDECNNALLDVTIDDIDDDAAVGDDADKQDDNNDPALQRLGEEEHWTRRPDGL